MSKRLFFELVHLNYLESTPANYSETLKVAGQNTYIGRYSVDYDPGEDGLDWHEIGIGKITFKEPVGWEQETLTYSDNTRGSLTRKKWHYLNVADDYQIPGEEPGEEPTGSLEESVSAGWDTFADKLGGYATSHLGYSASVAKKIKQAAELEDALRKHMSTQFDLLKKNLAGEIGTQELLDKNGAAAGKLLKDTIKISDLPSDIKKAVKYGTAIIEYTPEFGSEPKPSFKYEVGPKVELGASDEWRNVSAGAADNTIEIGPGVLLLDAGAGDDSIVEGRAEGAFVFGRTLSGGDGTDTFRWAAEGQGITVNLADQYADAAQYDESGVKLFEYSATLLNIENVAGNSGDDSLTGSSKANVIKGGAGSDWVDGGRGNDKLSGGTGQDQVFGGTGGDKLDAGAGADKIYAGSDNSKDVFVFERGDTGNKSATADRVYEFDRHNNGEKISDLIDLHRIDGDKAKHDQQLRFVSEFSTAKGSKPDGQVMVVDKGSYSRVDIDYNGDNHRDAAIYVVTNDGGNLHHSDFLL